MATTISTIASTSRALFALISPSTKFNHFIINLSAMIVYQQSFRTAKLHNFKHNSSMLVSLLRQLVSKYDYRSSIDFLFTTCFFVCTSDCFVCCCCNAKLMIVFVIVNVLYVIVAFLQSSGAHKIYS
jgi:bifunctional pyridoxal-dependent enzyme with beta-cystathionase and maltose regulon repressor activities